MKGFVADQIVTVATDSLSGPKSANEFRIVTRYPLNNRPAMYHVRCLVGRGQRMVPEGELAGVAEGPPTPASERPLWPTSDRGRPLTLGLL
jgi:hypothetical protein